MTSGILMEAHDGVTVVTINRPERRNSLDTPSQWALKHAFEAFEADASALVLVLTGAGEQSFCAGGDLAEMAAGIDPDPAAFPVLGHNVTVTKPVIAAVNGVALAGGFLLAQHADLCIASTNATFGITEARWGGGTTWAVLLPRMIGPRLTMELVLTARPIDAQRALAAGLVNRVVPPGELLDSAIEMARTIAANAPLSVRAGKAMVHAAVEYQAEELEALARALFAPAYAHPDAREGPRAFTQRRAPRWSGHLPDGGARPPAEPGPQSP